MYAAHDEIMAGLIRKNVLGIECVVDAQLM